jgi:NurA-like 5'-3' nuclease
MRPLRNVRITGYQIALQLAHDDLRINGQRTK